MPKQCVECGGEFTPSRSTQVFCEKKCNKRFHARKRRAVPGYKEAQKAFYLAEYERSPEHVRLRIRNNMRAKRWRAFGATPVDYERLLEAQDGRCAVCNVRPVKDLYFDHDHKTMTARGLLCHECNVGLGHFGDDVERLISAMSYLLGFTQPVHQALGLLDKEEVRNA